MKNQLIVLCILGSCMLSACDKTPPSPAKTNTRAIHIAGMPASDQDFRLNAQDNRMLAVAEQQ